MQGRIKGGNPTKCIAWRPSRNFDADRLASPPAKPKNVGLMRQPVAVLSQICLKSPEQTFYGTVIHVPINVCQIGGLLRHITR
jgi:hypothetical protein